MKDLPIRMIQNLIQKLAGLHAAYYENIVKFLCRERLGIFWLDERLLASEEEMYSIGFVSLGGVPAMFFLKQILHGTVDILIKN